MGLKDKDLLDEHATVASAAECTGLIAAMPEDIQKTCNQAELYAVHRAQPEKEVEKWRGRKKEKDPRL